MDTREELIRKFWSLFDQEKFEQVKSLLHAEFKAVWITSNEKFPSADSLIKMNEAYPGRWHTIPQRIELLEYDALSITSVYSDDSPERFYAISFFEFKEGLISKIIEYWATVENSPEWRKQFSIEYPT